MPGPHATLPSFDTVARHWPDPVMVLDAARRVVWTNDAAGSAHGDGQGAVLRHPALRAAIDRARPAGAPEVTVLALMTGDVAATVMAPDAAHTVVLLRDRGWEQALDRVRSDFIANASHELRTPLASLIGCIDTLQGPAADDPPAQARFLTIMAEQAARMRRLIDDLLSLSRVEAAEHQAPTARLHLPTLLPDITAWFDGLPTRGATLTVDLPNTLPPVLADADQLQQVLINLLENAVKYGREGGTVRLDAAAESGGVTIAVADDGPGIPRAHIPRLTERFYRVDAGRSRAMGGTGLGLSIVKHIIGRHRGRLTIESAEGIGTIFKVWLPSPPTP